MTKQKNNKLKTILGILAFIIIIIFAIYVQISNTDNLYGNLDIDKSKLNIFYLNVGQADSTLIIMGEEVMLIDAGDKSDGQYISQFLQAQGINEIDYLIETHSDDDHSGGIKYIVDNFNVRKIYMPKSAISESEILDLSRIQIFSDLNKEYNFDKATWRVLSVNNSEEISEGNDNNTSIVIQLNYENTKYLFMGDAETKIENQLISAGKLEKVDILKVSHHGSNYSSSEKFLEKVKPRYSIISVNNSEYKKHPDTRTLQRLQDIKSKIYRTDKNGTIWAISDGTNIEIKELDINLNGANRVAILLENRRYSLIFFILIHYHFYQQLYICHL